MQCRFFCCVQSPKHPCNKLTYHSKQIFSWWDPIFNEPNWVYRRFRYRGKKLKRSKRTRGTGNKKICEEAMASKLLLITVFVFDLIAFALAIAAEQRRSTATVQVDSEDNYSFCVYDSDIATGFGVGAFLFLMASQVLIMVASQCFCCGKALNPGGSRAWAVILFIICWVFFFIAEVCFLAGSVRNAYHTKYRRFFNDPPDCKTLRKGVFAAGAAFTFFTAIVSEFYYVCYSKARDSFQPYGGEIGLGMGTYK